MHTSASQSSDRTVELEQIVLEIIRTQLLPDLPGDCATDTDLFSVGLDSMGIMQMVLLLEEQFGCTVQPADLTRLNFTTASALATLIREKNRASRA